MAEQQGFTLLPGSKDEYFLYEWRSLNTGGNGVGECWISFLIQHNDPKKDPPENISFEDAWESYAGNPAGNINGGCYLFSRQKPADSAMFLESVTSLVQSLNKIQNHFSYRYFLWIYNPDAGSYNDLLPQSLPFTKDQNTNAYKIVNQTSNSFRNNAVSFGNIYLSLPKGVLVNASSDNNTFSFQNFDSGDLHIELWNSNGANQFGQVGDNVTVSLENNPGALVFDAVFNTLSVQGNDFIKMEAGTRYFIKTDNDTVKVQFYPLWRSQTVKEGATNVSYPINSALNPLWPEVHDLTCFQFAPHQDKTKELGSFESCFVTPNGHRVLLKPQATDTKLVLMAGMLNADSTKRDTTGLYYLAPSGSMVMSTVVSSNTQEHLMCGLSGIESITFQPETENTKGFLLEFEVDKPAFAPVFPFPQASPVGPPVDPDASLLDDTLTTSWLTLTKQDTTGESEYIGLPKGFSLYGCDDEINKGDREFLGFTAPASDFSLSGSYCFPMVPYTGIEEIDWSSDQVESFEREILSPSRRVIIAKYSTSLKAPGNTQCQNSQIINITTPSGQLVTLDTVGQWQKILLGQLTTPVESQFYFQQPKPPLTQAFQTSDLMLVIANPESLGTLSNGPGKDKTSPLFNNSLNIENWVLAAQVGDNYSYGDYSNIVIVKGTKGVLYDPGLDISENLIANPAKWTQKKDFSAPNGKTDELVPLTQWLLDYFKDAAEKGADKDNPDALYFEKFNLIATDAHWTGVLVLRARIDEIPEQIKGIAAGVNDKSAFYAHHFAIEISQTQIGASGPEIEGPSSVYGLIYYNDPAYDSNKPSAPVSPASGAIYDFRLLTLKVLFENSAVKHFQSYAQITLNKLFGSTVEKMGEGGNLYNSIILKGAFQENNGNPAYSLSTTQDSTFLFNNNVLNKIEIASVRMNTVSSTKEETEILFDMTGYIDFSILKNGEGDNELEIDLFSFGSEDGKTSHQGLHFSNAGLEMNYPTSTPEQKEFNFTTENIRFDIQSSTIREQSLYRSFALELEGLNSGNDENNTPLKQGFINVITDLRLSGVDGGAWNGLRFRLNLGTPGELAGKVGLNADLLLSWSTNGGDGSGYQANVGFHLPGATGGANLISLQNVLKLSFGPIRLLYAKESETSQDRRFMLLLTEIALKFLGLLKIPPNGATMFYLFGNPEAEGKSSGLGWYAMYKKSN